MQNNLTKEIVCMSGVDPKKCMKCGKCSASCPAFSEMEYHPHQFASMIVNGEIEPLLNSNALYLCLSCYACVERCPRGVEPAKLIEAVRLIKIRQKGMDHLNPGDVPGMLVDSIPQQALVSAFRKYKK